MKSDPLMLKAREEAVDCPHNHICLKGEQGHLCKVASEHGDKVLFLQNDQPKKLCPYCHAFGDDDICTCPVRYRLYSEYRI
ncbi:MAG: hypothetical protein MI702_03090 [Chlorobiales bacterium]|nr:hypothetical protein [Chlorobiales bacterium]